MGFTDFHLLENSLAKERHLPCHCNPCSKDALEICHTQWQCMSTVMKQGRPCVKCTMTDGHVDQSSLGALRRMALCLMHDAGAAQSRCPSGMVAHIIPVAQAHILHTAQRLRMGPSASLLPEHAHPIFIACSRSILKFQERPRHRTDK